VRKKEKARIKEEQGKPNAKIERESGWHSGQSDPCNISAPKN
jgi:hypothetical protein